MEKEQSTISSDAFAETGFSATIKGFLLILFIGFLCWNSLMRYFSAFNAPRFQLSTASN